MILIARSMTVSVRRPRKSNFTRPAASTSSLSNCVTTLPPLSSAYSGANSVSFDGAITTPPACMPALRVRPSSERARSMRFLLQRVVERDTELERNELGDLVDVAVTHAEHAAHVAHHGLRRHGAVGDDL